MSALPAGSSAASAEAARFTSRSVKPAREGKPRSDELGFARYAYTVAAFAALVWAGGLTAFVAGFQTQFGAFDYSPLQWVVIGLLAVLPASFMILSAFALRQGARLALETRRARAMADEMAIPAALAADQTGGAMEAMRHEIEKAAEAARAARGPILSLRETLSVESQRLSEAAAQAQATGRLLAEILAEERTALGELNDSMKSQATASASALSHQARVVADASDLAQVQLDEAQAALTARAADLAVAAGDARHATELAADQLTRQIDRLETAGAGVGDRVGALSEGLGRQRESLAGLAETLRNDQEDLSVQIETHRAQLAEAAIDARDGAAAFAAASAQGADALRTLIATAAEEVRALAEAAHREQAALDTQARAAIGLFSGAVAEERAAIEAQTRAAIGDLALAAEEARQAAANHIETAAEAVQAHADAARSGLNLVADDIAARIDNLGEAAFAASQQADKVFDSRVAAARRMIEQSAALVEETGERSASRIEAGVAAARGSLADMEGLLSEIDARMDRLPSEAGRHAASIRQAIEQGMGDLTAAARRAAEETQEIDAAFQERVRRNYEILSDAVRMMGRVAGAAAPAPAPASAPAPAPAAPVIKPAAPMIKPAAVETAPVLEAMPELRAAVVGDRGSRISMAEGSSANAGASARLGGSGGDVVRPAALSDPYAADPAPRRIDTITAAGAGLRPRLKLTSAPGEGPPAVPPSPQAPIQLETADRSSSDEWTWKDLLSSMDEPGADDDALAERLIAEIEALGVDSGALLPRPRIDEIAAALQTGDAGGAREVVRRLAPAAVRRLSRRVLTDKVLRAQADRYVRRYEELLSDSAQRDREGYMMAALLGSDPGRAFLLLDAAVGDLH
ncbi:MAG TPA: polar localization protein TipN [Caulobacteraceae bacterium]|nr:polar localization protein TipN [Caulobacteraceae bacterium]